MNSIEANFWDDTVWQNFDVSMYIGIWKAQAFLLRTKARKRSKIDSWCIIDDGSDVTHSVFRNHVCCSCL